MTDEQQQRVLRAYVRSPSLAAAARAARVTPSAVYAARRNDPLFAERLADAEREVADALDAEAYRRAVEGVDEPVFWQGMLVDTVRKYSDSLLAAMLKAKRPEYRERISAELSGPDGAALRLVIGDSAAVARGAAP